MSLIPDNQRPTPEHLEDFLYAYQQAQPAYSDPLGDFVLASLMERIPERIALSTIFGDSSLGATATERRETYDPDAPVEPSLPAPVQLIEGRINPIREQPMIDAFTQVIREETRDGIAPSAGHVHVWSSQFTEHCSIRFMGMIKFSKIIEALARGDSSRFMMTAADADLKAWILAQKDASIEPHELFRQSYILNHGDLYNSFLTIENVLSREWRNPERENLVLTRHLAPMANFYQGRGTNFGVWYHFFGVVYYGYVYGEDLAWIAGAIEHVGSLIMGHFAPQMQKGAVNLTGGAIGAAIRKALNNGTYLKGPDEPQTLDPSKYLNLTEDYRDRIEVKSDPAFRLTIDDDRIWITSLERDLKGCSLELIVDTGFGISNGQTYRQSTLDLPRAKPVRIHVTAEGIVGARAFLDGCSF
jgi:hypothetical protein